MTLTVRTPAKLYHVETAEFLAGGIAVIWGDAVEWGGIFDAQENAEAVRSAVAGQALTARLETLDGRVATITLTPSEFVADGDRPLTFRGQGEIDTSRHKAFSGSAVTGSK